MPPDTTPTTSLYQHYAADAAESYEAHFVPAIGLPAARRLLAAADLRPGERVLDVACGTGVAARLAADEVGDEGDVSGLDANPGMLAVARRVAPGIDWRQASAEAMPLADATVDVVLCSMGLQFFSDRLEALREMHRVLVPGGRVLVGTPGPTPPLFQEIDRALTEHVGPGASMFVHAVFSLHDPAQARDLLDAAGFADVDADTAPLSLRVAPPVDFFWQYVHSTPLAAVIGELDEAERVALERDVEAWCQPFVDEGATVMEPGLLVARGERAEGGRS